MPKLEISWVVGSIPLHSDWGAVARYLGNWASKNPRNR